MTRCSSIRRATAALLLVLASSCGRTPAKPAPEVPPPAATTPTPELPRMMSNAPAGTVDADYAEDFGVLHAAYAAAIARAQGKPIPEDAPLYAPNAIAHDGNSYRVETISVLLLAASAQLYQGLFDPHLLQGKSAAVPPAIDIEAAQSAVEQRRPLLEKRAGRVRLLAPLTYGEASCAKCHPIGQQIPVCLLYELPELADD